MTFDMLVFDTETTAADPEVARIVSAYLGVLAPDGSLIMEQEWLVRPDGFQVSAESTAIHGITHEHAAQRGQPLADVVGQLASIIRAECFGRPAPLVGHNIGYDLTVLDREAGRLWPELSIGDLIAGIAVLDTYVLDKQLYRFRKGTGARKLIRLAEAYGVHLTEDEAHGARADAIAAGRIAQKQLTKPSLRGASLRQIHDAQIGWRADQCADLQQWFRTKAPADRRDPNMVIDPRWPFIPRSTTTTTQGVAA